MTAENDSAAEAAAAATAVSTVTYEQLADLETDFDDVDLQLLIYQEHLSRPLYAKRAALIAQIPHFWALVLEQAPPDLDPYIQPSDSHVFAESLLGLHVERFEIQDESKDKIDDGTRETVRSSNGSSGSDASPRSLKFRFEFSPNEWFEDRILEKKFWFRRAATKRDGGGGGGGGGGGWTALVSEPVKIHWKMGKDLTGGLTDAAVAYWEAKRRMSDGRDPAMMGSERDLPEYRALAGKVGSSDEGTRSFFAWFGFTAGRRYIGAEESAVANKAVAERREKRRRRMEGKEKKNHVEAMEKEDADKSNELGEDDDDDDDGDDDDDDEDSNPAQETEIFPNGEELATLLAEEIWPQAIKYFTEAQEIDDQDLSDMDMEDDEDDGASDNDSSDSLVSEDGSGGGAAATVGKRGKKKKNKQKKSKKIDIQSLVTDRPKRKASSDPDPDPDPDSGSGSGSGSASAKAGAEHSSRKKR